MNIEFRIACLIGLLFCASCSAQTPNTVIPLSSTDLTEPPQATPIGWKSFKGAGYILSYPSDWYAYQPHHDASEASSVAYDLILSDKPGNQSPQGATLDEQARVTIWYILKPAQTLESWVVEKWAWMNTDIHSVSFGGRDALSASLETSDPPLYDVYYWVEIGDYIYIIQAYSRSDLATKLGQTQTIIDSLVFER